MGTKPKAKKYIIRNFALYRLSGMMGNLSHMLYEFRNDEELNELISEAMDAVAELGHTLKVHRDPGQRDEVEMTPRVRREFLLRGLASKLSETYNQERKKVQ